MKLKGFYVRVAEMAMSIGAVLVFFLLFVGILSISFPKGTGLRDLLVYDDSRDLAGGGVDLDLTGSGPDSISFVARLTDVTRRVKDKRPNSISWQEARAGIRLESRHAVQTFSHSSAKIAFDDVNAMELGENSLVIIRKLEQAAAGNQRRASIVILDGAVRGSVGKGGESMMELEVVTSGAVSKIQSNQEAGTDFKVVANADSSATIAVFSGNANVTAGARTLDLGANQVIRVDDAGNILGPTALPAVPSLTAPATRAEYTYGTIPPEVRLSWEAVDAADDYRVQIAGDPDFEDLVLDSVVPVPELVHANLPAGRYFWRVNARTHEFDCDSTAARMFDVTHDADPPRLEVELVEPNPEGTRCRLKGLTEPGAQVFVGQQTIPITATGEFDYDLSLEPGPNVLLVEAFDPAGNVTYVSRMVQAKTQVKP